MKHTLRYCFLLLALATTGMFAQAAAEPADTSAPAQHKTVKGKKAHKKHQKHKKKKADKKTDGK